MKERQYVALGDLVTDCYYQNGELLKIDGGSSRFNVIANLAARGNNTYVISACGNDKLGQISLNSLNTLNVNTKLVKQIGSQTRAYHLIVENNRHLSIKNCPICGRKTWYETPLADTNYCLSHLNSDDIIILDGLKPENLSLLNCAKQDKVLDIGRIKRLILLKNEEILSILHTANLEILQLNETVANYLMIRFKISNPEGLYYLLKAKLLVITRGKKGATFITKQLVVNKELLQYEKELDDTGAGDAFFSVIIQSYFDNNKIVDKNWVDETFILANKITCQTVAHHGARGHLLKGYYPENGHNCICNK